MGSIAAAKTETTKRWSSIRLMLRDREPRAPGIYVLPARVVVVLAGLLLATNGVFLLSAAWFGGSFGLLILGASFIPLSLLLIRSALRRMPEDFSCAPVAFVAELLFRIVG